MLLSLTGRSNASLAPSLLPLAKRAQALICPKIELGGPSRQSSVRQGNPHHSYDQNLPARQRSASQWWSRKTPEALGALLKAGANRIWPLIKEFGIKAL